MIEIFLIIIIALNLALLLMFFFKKSSVAKDNSSELTDFIEKLQTRSESVLRDEMVRNRTETAEQSKQTREEVTNAFKSFGDSIDKRIFDSSTIQGKNFEMFAQKLADLTEKNEQRFENIKETIQLKIEFLQKDNNEQLEKMRLTVDEKLSDTLDKRLGEKFKLVSDRLEQVHRGLGEMQTLATGVGDLKKVLSNVKTRGTWGEVQLGNLLDQVLTVEQYEKNVATKNGSADRVEFAIKLPGKDDHIKQIWVPIDSKFPIEDYQRLIDAEEKVDLIAIEAAGKALELRIKGEAKYIKEKYIDPPYTTDFGILYLPIEGLYAEVVKKVGLCEILQRDYRVIIVGPNTFLALLNSLQMGFKTLAIEKRSSEVWSLLDAIKNDFSKFGDLLDKTSKKLAEASNVIEDASVRSRVIQKKLDKVQGLPIGETPALDSVAPPEDIFGL